MPVKERIGRQEGERYWAFEMEHAGRHDEYFFTLLDDDQGHQWINFYTYAADAEWGIEHHMITSGDLYLPFALFSRAVEELFESQSGLAPMGDRGEKGGFGRLPDDRVLYRTACGMEFIIEPDVLKDIAG